MSLGKIPTLLCLLHHSVCLCCYVTFTSSPRKNVLVIRKNDAPRSCFSSVVPLFFHIMSAHHEVHAHVEKKGLPHIQKYFSLSLPPFSLSLSNSHAHRNSCACLRAYTLRRARRRARPQTVSCVLPTASSTKTEHTACPCLTHIYTHRPMCTHKLRNSPLHTLKGT